MLDANILIRAVLGNKVRRFLEEYHGTIGFFTPELCYEDAKKYLPSIFQQRGLPVDDLINILELISSFVRPVPEEIYSIYEVKAKARMMKRDIDDWPIAALALMLDCPIWTEDKDFFGSGIATWQTEALSYI